MPIGYLLGLWEYHKQFLGLAKPKRMWSSYAVPKKNLGEAASLFASSALKIDYILTITVSISSSTAAIVSAFPSLEEVDPFQP